MTKKMIEKNQRQRFEETARQLECNEDEAKYNAYLERIAASKEAEKPKE